MEAAHHPRASAATARRTSPAPLLTERPHGGPQQVSLLTVFAISLGYFMTIVDATIVNVALPDLATRLGGGLSSLQWVVDGYAVAFAACLLTAGALGDRYGSRFAFLAGVVAFTVASALCGAAPTLHSLVAWRVIQGAAAAIVVPTSLALLRHSYTDPRARARAIGWWGAISGIGASTGPVLGGALVALWGWRGVFFVNIPVGVLSLILVRRRVSAPPADRSRDGLDLPAQALALFALGTLTFAVVEGGHAWPPTASSILIAVAALIAAFALVRRELVREGRALPVMLPPSLFRKRAFSAGTLVGWLINFAFYGHFFLLALFFEHARGASPLATGLALLPESCVIPLAAYLSGRVASRTGPRFPMALGLSLGAIGFVALSLAQVGTPYILLAPSLLLIGTGMSTTMPAMTVAVIEAAPKERAGLAAGILNASRQAGGGFGVAILGAFAAQLTVQGGGASGMHIAMLIAASAFVTALALTLRMIPGRTHYHNVS